MDDITTINITVISQNIADNSTVSTNNENHVEVSNKMHKKAVRALLWKLDKRLIPFLTLLELGSFLNRINIGKRCEFHHVVLKQDI